MKVLSLCFVLVMMTFSQTAKVRPKSHANPCQSALSQSYDKVSGNSYTIGSRDVIVSDDKRTGFVISVQSSFRSGIILSIRVVQPSAGCISDKAKVEVLFRDGTRLQTSSNSSFNCDGKVAFYFGDVFGNETLLDQFSKKPIEALRVSAYKSSVQRDFSIANSSLLVKQLSCINEEMVAAKKKGDDALAELESLEKLTTTTTGSAELTYSRPTEAKTIDGGVLNGKATSLPKPPYSPAARAVRASGAVSVRILISTTGSVLSAEPVSGHPLLRPAAVSAARAARFSPTLLAGQPVNVSGILTFNFVP